MSEEFAMARPTILRNGKLRFGRVPRGFTLIEVLVAIVLLALLMAGAYAGIKASTGAVAKGEALIDRTEKIRVAHQFLRREISQAIALPFSKPQDITKREVFVGEEDRMRYVAPMPGHLGFGGAYVQELTFEDGIDGLSLVFRHALLNGFEEENLEDDELTKPVVLLEHIQRASFEYKALDERGQLAEWSADWDKPAQLPLLVKIDVEFTPESRYEWPALVVPVMVDASAATAPFEPSFFNR